jgi:hypothetical protein
MWLRSWRGGPWPAPERVAGEDHDPGDEEQVIPAADHVPDPEPDELGDRLRFAGQAVRERGAWRHQRPKPDQDEDRDGTAAHAEPDDNSNV